MKTALREAAISIRNSGYRVTKPRIKIMSELMSANTPLSADELHDRLRKSVDRVTVYRTLSMLEKAGVVSRFTFENKHVYEPSMHHGHYLVCKECKQVERISSCTLHDIEKSSLKASRKFASVDAHLLQFIGTCSACS